MKARRNAREDVDRMTDYEMNLYDKETIYPDCTVQLLTNTVTGEQSVGWWPNPNRLKAGDTVYQTDGVNVYESKIRKVIYDTGHFAFDDEAIGRSVWLSREETEAALGGTEKEP